MREYTQQSQPLWSGLERRKSEQSRSQTGLSEEPAFELMMG